MNRILAFTALTTALSGCTKGIDFDDTAGDAIITFDCAEDAYSTSLSTINATADDVWIYLDFESCGIIEPDNPSNTPSWDLALQRYMPKINGGISGSGDMEVAVFRPTGDYLRQLEKSRVPSGAICHVQPAKT